MDANPSKFSLPALKETNFKFDEKGYIIFHTELFTGGRTNDKINKKEDPDIIKDSEGKILKHINRFSDGRVLNTSTYFYDENDNLIKEDVTDFNGELHLRYILKYDENNNLINKGEYYGDGALVSQVTYRYDNNNRMTEKFRYDKGLADLYNIPNLTGEFYYQYNYKGQLIKETYVVDGHVFELKEFNYDEKGNMTRTWGYKSFEIKEAFSHHYTYKFDYNQNGVERISFTNIEPKTITTREITYY